MLCLVFNQLNINRNNLIVLLNKTRWNKLLQQALNLYKHLLLWMQNLYITIDLKLVKNILVYTFSIRSLNIFVIFSKHAIYLFYSFKIKYKNTRVLHLKKSIQYLVDITLATLLSRLSCLHLCMKNCLMFLTYRIHIKI